MTIDTQKLRQIGTLLDEGYQINDHSGIVTQAAAALDAQAWRDIETAPKYIWVLIWREGIVPRVAMLTEPVRAIPPEEIKHEIRDADDNEQGWWSDAYGWQDGSDAPTHWMPLPAAPDALLETPHDR